MKLLQSDHNLRDRWAKRLGPKKKPRIGLVWSGSSTNENDHNRSLKLKQLLPLLTDRAEFIALHKEVRKVDRNEINSNGRIAYFGNELDFDNTAAVIDLLDVVISVDTSIAHLAGAMGKSVWVLLSFNPDWRWMLSREDSPWYSSARLFRQPKFGDWESVFKCVENELENLF